MAKTIKKSNIKKNVKKTVKEINKEVKETIKEVDTKLNKDLKESTKKHTDVNVESEKFEKKVRQKIGIDDLDLDLDNISKNATYISVFGMILNIFIIIALFVFLIYSSIVLIKYGLDGVTGDYSVTRFVEFANYGEAGADILSSYDNTIAFYVFEIVVPLVGILVSVGSLILFWHYFYKIFKNVKEDKQLFTKGKLELIKRMRTIGSLVLIMCVLIFDVEFFIIWVFGELILEVIVYVFDYAVRKTI